MDNIISLRPQYFNNSNKWKQETHSNTNNKNNSNSKNNNKYNKNDVWGFYENPHYDPVKEYIEQQPIYTKSQYDDTTLDVLYQILPLQRHLLRGNEFKRIYFRNDNSVHYNKRTPHVHKEVENEEVKPEEEQPENDDIIDDETAFEDDNEYYSDVEQDYRDEYKNDFRE